MWQGAAGEGDKTMGETRGFLTLSEIERAAEAAGSHWFDQRTMRHHRTRRTKTCITTPTGAIFLTTDGAGFDPADGRGYTVREATREPFGVRTAEGHSVAEFSNGRTAERVADRRKAEHSD